MSKVIGNTTATPMTVPDWSQDNPNRADYIKNKPSNDEMRQDLGIVGIETILDDLYSNRVPALEENKADKTYVDEQILTKTVPVEVFSDVYFNRLPAVEANKADKSYVEEKVADKADKSYVDEQLKTKADDADYQNFKEDTAGIIMSVLQQTIPQLDARKADKTYVDEQIGDIETALDGIIAIQNSLLGGDSK